MDVRWNLLEIVMPKEIKILFQSTREYPTQAEKSPVHN